LTQNATQGKLQVSNAKDFLFRVYEGGYQTAARLVSNLGGFTGLEILKSGSLIPYATKIPSLGSAAKYWNQAFIDYLLISTGIDLEPCVDPYIYFDHDGPTAEDALRYDKSTNHLEVVIGGTVRAYCDATGWH
jgi:hypothetical protein